MGSVKGFKDLIAWQKGMERVEEVYRLSAGFPRHEQFGLTAQVRRAAVSIPSNVAEGYGRPGKADYVRFLDIARGSANEVETQLLLAERLRFVPPERSRQAMQLVNEVQRVLKGLVDSIERSHRVSFRANTQSDARS